MSILTIYLTKRVWDNYKETSYKPNKKYWILAAILILVWLIFSGIGDFSFQNKDFHFRHAMLRDLINYSWPVKYEKYGLVYYFTYFLPSALFGKITNYHLSNIFLFIYSYIALLHILYLINRYLKKDSKYSLLLFIMFSGLDALGIPNKIFTIAELEWWNGLFQYSANTVQLYWTFNQAIPLWIITALLLNTDNNKNILFISTLAFFYSPFATIGLVPIAICLYLKNTKNLKKEILSLELLNAIIIMLVLGLYYTSGNGSTQSGFIFNIVKNKAIILPSYILFILFEITMYIIPTYKNNKKDILYKTVLLELLILPIYVITENNDLCMRGSLSALFILMIYFIKYLDSKEKKHPLIYLLLLISFINPIHEFSRSIYYTFTKDNYLADDIKSINKPQGYKDLVEFQFYGNLNSFYFKYISK